MASTTIIGTWEWACQTGGKLSHTDKTQLASLVQHLSRRTGDRTEVAQSLARIDFDQLTIPDSAMARQALQLCSEVSPIELTNHCLRTYLWAYALAQLENLRFDEELLYVAAILHDLGLTPAYNNRQPGIDCFAVEGAMAAKEFVAQRGWDEHRQKLLAEAISLHLNLRVELGRGVEAHLLNAGAAVDVIGARLNLIEPETAEKVLELYPRVSFKKVVSRLLAEQAKLRPDSRSYFLFNTVDFEARIQAAPFAS